MSLELVSAVVCTRNRAEPTARCVESLLAGESSPIELLVIDQSDGTETEQALSRFQADARLRYVRSERRGKGAALNQALQLARGSILVCTDDDCQAPPGWIWGMARALESQPSAAVAFCRVLPVPHDRSAGYVPAYELSSSRLLRSISAICGGLGIGAGVALRRDFLLSIGGFDEAFGPGGRFPSADDWDLAMRSLLSGRHVFETAELTIVHDGFRTFEEGRAHARRDWLALGAVCAKPLRAGYWQAAVVPVWLFSTKALWPPLADALALRRPRGAGRIVAFVQGFARGLRQRVEPKTLRFL
ncbi:MAG TPA: glycosyltransferase family 2 protein [Polyangiaceae bacterium]|nr:glycosyltransferase family 2 protein [Polyangiaceae bacterium]